MCLETELKFYCSDFKELRDKLVILGADFKSRFFEENIVFDTPDRSLRSRGALLRLRSSGANVLCFKETLADSNEEVKTRREIETGVEDFGKTRSILEGLGYRAVLFYEKVREKWLTGTCVVCLDKLPFGNFVEMEGLQDEIYRCASHLGLLKKDSTAKSYHELNREYRRQQGLPQNESFVFTEPLRSKLIHELQSDNFQPETL